MHIKFLLESPGPPAIIFSATDIQATSLTVKWTAPVDDGRCPITAYRMVILKGGTEIKSVNITDPGITIRYAVIGHLPSSTGAVHFTVSEVA